MSLETNQILLPFPATCVPGCGGSARISLLPQMVLRGPFRIRFPPSLHGLLVIRNIQFGQETCFACAGSLPVESLEQIPDLDGYVLHLGNTIMLEVENISPSTVLVIGTVLAHQPRSLSTVEYRPTGVRDKEKGWRSSFKRGIDPQFLIDTDYADDFDMSPPQLLFRPDCVPVPSDLRVELERERARHGLGDFGVPIKPHQLFRPERLAITVCDERHPFTNARCQLQSEHMGQHSDLEGTTWYAPRVTCEARRPDTHETCVLRRGHLEQHFDGLGQIWPEQATPSRKELERRAYDREHYLQDADAWSAWESPTDEG